MTNNRFMLSVALLDWIVSRVTHTFVLVVSGTSHNLPLIDGRGLSLSGNILDLTYHGHHRVWDKPIPTDFLLQHRREWRWGRCRRAGSKCKKNFHERYPGRYKSTLSLFILGHNWRQMKTWLTWSSFKSITNLLPLQELYTSISTLAQKLVLTLVNNELILEKSKFNPVRWKIRKHFRSEIHKSQISA